MSTPRTGARGATLVPPGSLREAATIRRQTPYSVEALNGWRVRGEGHEVTAAEHNAGVVSLAASLDLLAAPTTLVDAAGVVHYPEDEGRSVVGLLSRPASLRELALRAGQTPEETQRRTLALAAAWALMDLYQAPRPDAPRSSGLAPLTAVVVVVGVAALALVVHEVTAAVRERSAADVRVIERAADAGAERFRVLRQTGTLPPETAVEQGAGELLRRRAGTALEDLGVGLERVAGGAAKMGLVVGGLALGYTLLKGRT